MKRRLLLRVLAALAAACCACAGAQSSRPARPVPNARAVLEACVEQAGASLRGLEALGEACPGIDVAIEDLHLDAQLPADWQQHVSTGALSDWCALADRYDPRGPAARLPEPARLQDIARGLPRQVIRQPTLWEQARAWFRAWLDKHFNGQGTQRVLSVLVLGLLGLAVLGAAVIVYVELRASGVRVRRAGWRQLARPDTQMPQAPQEPPGIDLAAAPPRLRPVLLLRMLVTVLTRARRLEDERVLTCRELVSSARFDVEGQRERFAALTVLAERGLYGDPLKEPLPHQDAVLAEARPLEAQLRAPASPQVVLR